MKFGLIKSYILLGGGKLFFKVILLFKEKNIPFSVVTSSRHLEEKITKKSFKECLEDNEIDYINSENINDDQEVINKIDSNTMGISMSASWILSKTFIEKFEGRLVNVHGTRLPQNRGGGTFSWQILNKNHLGFCLIHQLKEGIDTGAIVTYLEFLYPDKCRTPNDYMLMYNEKNENFLMKFVDDIQADKEFFETRQSEYFSTYWPRISSKHQGYIDWSWNLSQIESFICAFDDPYPGATTFINEKKVSLKKCMIDHNDGGFHPYQKGIIYKKSMDSLFIATEEGTLIIGEVLDENGSNIFSEPKVGDRCYTPVDLLEKAKQFRAIFTSKGLKTK